MSSVPQLYFDKQSNYISNGEQKAIALFLGAVPEVVGKMHT